MREVRNLASSASRPLGALALTAAGGLFLRLLTGVGFANYDTLYALSWGQQIWRGETPQYAIAIAPTPHPLMEALGALTGALSASTAEAIAVWIGYVSLAACAWLIYRLGARWLNRPAGALAALILITRTPILSYGARAYVDLPFLGLMLGALLSESGKPRAGARTMTLLALAGLLRPEAWVFAGLYWLYLAAQGRLRFEREARGALPIARVRRIAPGDHSVTGAPAALTVGAGAADPGGRAQAARGPSALLGLAAIAVSAPALWLFSDLAITGNLLWSLHHTAGTASTLGRKTGLANVPEYIPRRIGEIMRPAELLAAALGGLLALRHLLSRVALPAIAGLVAVLVFAALATFGLPIGTRYAFFAAAVLCIFCGAGIFGWKLLPKEHRVRRPWALAATASGLWLLGSLPGQIAGAGNEMAALRVQQRIQASLIDLLGRDQAHVPCLPVVVPSHPPIPLLALYLRVRPGRIRNAESQRAAIGNGTYIEAANDFVRREYRLDEPDEEAAAPGIPPGFALLRSNADWLEFASCDASRRALR